MVRFIVLAFAVILLLVSSPIGSTTVLYTEDFISTQYRDTLFTTALWDTVAGELKLPPFEITLTGDYEDIQPTVSDSPEYRSYVRIALAGDFAYVAAVKGIEVLDISNPAYLSKVGDCDTPGDARYLAISGNYAYVSDGEYGLTVIDISEPTNPLLVGNCDTLYKAGAITISGNYAYVSDVNDKFLVIGISDPTNPMIVGSYDGLGYVGRICISGDYAFVSGYYSFRVFDITYPANPTQAGICYTRAGAFAISGDYAYVVSNVDDALKVIDISDPTNPVLLSIYSSSFNVADVAISGDYLYLTGPGVGMVPLQVYDISNPTDPILVTSFNNDILGNCFSLAISGDYLFIVDMTGLPVLRIAEPVLPPLLAGANETGYGIGVDVSGNYAYMAAGAEGFRVIDIIDPTAPTTVATHATNYANDVKVEGDYAFVPDYSEGLKVFDITNPTAPTLAGSCDTPGLTNRMDISGNYAYVTDGDFGLQVINITEPASPVIAGNYGDPGPVDVAVDGDYAYTTYGAEGFKVIDISDPTNPALAGSGDTPGIAMGIMVSGDHAFVADGVSGLAVFDIIDPANPIIVGNVDPAGNAFDVEIAGDYLFLADYDNGIDVINISDPANPAIIDNCPTDQAYQVKVAGDYAFVADGSGGLKVLQVFQRSVQREDNVGQSKIISEEGRVSRARLVTNQTGSIRWELSADGGYCWQEVLPNGEWQDLTQPGSFPLWRSTHLYSEAGVNPACASLQLELEIDTSPQTEVTVSGAVRSDCLVSLEGVTVDMVDADGIFHTTLTNEDGYYAFRDIPVSEDPGDISIVIPLGYDAISPEHGEQSTSLTADQFVSFDLACIESSGQVRYPGYWLHQANVYLNDKGEPQESEEDMRVNFPEEIFDHFYGNLLNGIEVEGVTFIAPANPAPLDLATILNTLDTDSGWTPLERAKQQLLALLLNIVSEKLPMSTVVATDGATVSQAVQYIEELVVDSDPENDELAEEIASVINKGQQVPYGVIPLGISRIAYVRDARGLLGRLELEQNYPNPFNPSTAIRYFLPERGRVTLDIYDVSGRRIVRLIEREQEKGSHVARWMGMDERGNAVVTGVYFCVLRAGSKTVTRKMVLLR